MKRFLLTFTSIICVLPLWAKEDLAPVTVHHDDSIRFKSKFSQKLDQFTDSRLYRMTYIGVPLIVGGLAVKSEDDHFRSLRNDYLPRFNHHADDYLQYAPAAVMLGMKAFGVKGRSSWARMLVSDAFSILLMASTVNTLKRTTHVVRPDGSNDHSFPSGHTATAFMTATMLTKEYGHISPWISIGAYTVASSTGLMRMANNKHWLSDVLTGAGIGMLSTELGYYLADLQFKKRGIYHKADEDQFDRMDKPSFISLYLGLNIPLSNYDVDEQTVLHIASGCTAGVEGAYFFNPYIGVGGRIVISNSSILINNEMAADHTLDVGSLCGGVYFSYPLSARWLIGSKLIGGHAHYTRLKLIEQTIPARDVLCLGSGISMTFNVRERCGVRIFLDYNLMPSQSNGSAEWIHMLTRGVSVAVTL